MAILRIAWAALYFTGMVMVMADLAFRSVYSVNGIPVVSTLGAALVLLSLTSVLNWLFKEAWEERNRCNSK